MTDENPRRSRLLALAARANPFDAHGRRSSQSLQPLSGGSPSSRSGYQRSFTRSPSPSHSYSDPFSSSHDHSHSHGTTENMADEELQPPNRPFSSVNADGSGLSSRRSSFSSDKRDRDSTVNPRPASLSINYVPAKFTKLHAPGDYAHRRPKQGGGRDAFAKDAQRMGMMGTVDDDEGVVFQLGKGGLKKKKPKLRWNRFKWIVFGCNTLLIAYGLAFLVAAILVWLNVFYQSDVIRVGNRTELILSTTAGAMITLTALVGYSGIVLNNRAFLAVWTLFLWICLALIVAPGYLTYKQKTFNLEGKINLQWSRYLGSDGRLRIQDALRCCGYFSPYVEATQSPLCYSRSNFPGCKNKYLKLERHVLTTWYTIAFALVPAHILIITAALLCSNHITYRFGKGLTPKRYRLDLGSMAVIMDEYASQIAAQYGPGLAHEALNRSSTNLVNPDSPRQSISLSDSRRGSGSNLTAMTTGAAPSMTRPTSRFQTQGTGGASTASTGYNSQRTASALYDPSTTNFDDGSPTYHDNEADARFADHEQDDWDLQHNQYDQQANNRAGVGAGQQNQSSSTYLAPPVESNWQAR